MISFSSVYTTLFISSKQEESIQILCFSRGKITQRKPTIRGKIEYHFKQKDFWRPWRIFWEEQGKWKPYPPKNTIQEVLIKSKRILLSIKLSQKEKEGIKSFCKDFSISTPLEEVVLCPFCLMHDRITLLPSEGNFFVYERSVCKSCAIQELENELKAKKINLLTSPGFKKYALNLLDNLHDIQKVSTVFTGDLAVIGDYTLIQKIEKVPEPVIKPFIKKVTEYSLPIFLQESLKSRGIHSFLPIQVQALQKGLLRNENQLIIANTSAGKTLIGELAGISHVIKEKKFIFTVPLVALANTKFDEFKKFYGSKFKVGLRTGRSRIFNTLEEKKAFYKNRYSIKDSDIIVATYEGLDLLMRGGQVDFNSIGCIVIDEVQSLADPDRGPTLDCLIAKIRVYTRKTQIIALSATIGNPIQFTEDLSLTLVTFDQRPIPLEKHMLLSRSEQEKRRQILKLTQKEYQLKSSIGYRGQSLVFTNSRRKTSEIAQALHYAGVRNVHAYHSGLSYALRRRIETEFSNGKCPIVISTYALGAGVDFPASQVIFESLMMGNVILEPNSFTQMLGRAGRLGKHDRGRVILLCLGESISSMDPRSEVEIAFELLNAGLSPIEPNHDRNSCGEQILSICSTKKFTSPTVAREIFQRMIGTGNFDFMDVTNQLIGFSLIQITTKAQKRSLELTSLGQAAVLSFFSPEKVLLIKSLLNSRKHFLSIALKMSPPQNVYLSKKLHKYLEKTYHMRFSTRLINSPVLDVMNASLKGKEATELSKWCLNIFSRWTQHFFNCDCPENPYCYHGQENIGRFIINERLSQKSINQISASLARLELLIYPGDVLSFLNGLIHELEGVQRIAHAEKRSKIEKMITILIQKIETPPSVKKN
jgi:helicase